MPTGDKMAIKWADPDYRAARARNAYKPLLPEEVKSDMIVFLDRQESTRNINGVDCGMLRILVECPKCHDQRWSLVNAIRKGKINTTFCKKCSATIRKPRKKKGWWLTNGYKEVLVEMLDAETKELVEKHLPGKSTIYEHRAVALKKFGPAAIQPKVVVRHLDGNKLNNNPSNLAIGSQGENIVDHVTDRKAAQFWRGLAIELAMRYWGEDISWITPDILYDPEQDPRYYGTVG